MVLPKFTIVTPSMNQGVFLEDTIRSVLTQDYANVEYLVMDGGSTDESIQIIKKYQGELDYWQSQRDGGQASAIADGFDRSTGEIMGWLNSDDILLPGALDAVAKYFRENPEVEVVSGGAYCIDEFGEPVRRRVGNYTRGVAATYDRMRFYELDGVYQPATFWRRTAYESVGGLNRDFRFVMDWDLFIRFAKKRRFGIMPQMLACFRVHGDSKSMSIQDVRRAESALLREKYGVNRYGTLLRNLMYYRYRVPSLARKGWLALFLRLRGIELDRVRR